MFPESSAPPTSQAWVRNVSERAAERFRHANRTERNSYSLAANTKSAYELISNRIANIGTFTTGLLEQEMYSGSLVDYAQLAALPVLYEYASGDTQVKTAITHRIPFAKYNELTVTADGYNYMRTTSTSATDLTGNPLMPMIMATIPPLGLMQANGTYVQNQLTYASRWTVENFEPFTNYNIPGNVVPNDYSQTYGASGPAVYHPLSGTTQNKIQRDGYSSYSMKYTREWLNEYMQSILEYTTENTPPPAGARYFPPDVNQVEIILGYYYRIYTGPGTNVLMVNDPRMIFEAGATYSLEGVRNMGF